MIKGKVREETCRELLVALPRCWPVGSNAQQEETYDYGRQGFSRWDLAREVLKAFEAPRS